VHAGYDPADTESGELMFLKRPKRPMILITTEDDWKCWRIVTGLRRMKRRGITGPLALLRYETWVAARYYNGVFYDLEAIFELVQP
jgi:hypothetical protein